MTRRALVSCLTHTGWPHATWVHISVSPESVGGVARAVLVADEAVEARRTEPLLTVRPFKPCVAQARPVDVVTFASVLTVTAKGTLRTIAPHRTLFLTPKTQTFTFSRRSYPEGLGVSTGTFPHLGSARNRTGNLPITSPIPSPLSHLTPYVPKHATLSTHP